VLSWVEWLTLTPYASVDVGGAAFPNDSTNGGVLKRIPVDMFLYFNKSVADGGFAAVFFNF
jgi:hypothetical protein